MASKKNSVGAAAWHPISIKKRTSIGASPLSRPANKRKRASHKRYRGQGR